MHFNFFYLHATMQESPKIELENLKDKANRLHDSWFMEYWQPEADRQKKKHLKKRSERNERLPCTQLNLLLVQSHAQRLSSRSRSLAY
jgi:hypothetical protein